MVIRTFQYKRSPCNFNILPFNFAHSINDCDQIVGSITYSGTQYRYSFSVEHAFIDTNGMITDLENIGGGLRINFEANSVNNVGQVTGYLTALNGTIHAFLYDNGTMADLGTFPPYNSYGISINDSEEIDGNIESAYGAGLGAFYYAHDQLSNLENISDADILGWTQLQVSESNDNVFIVGTGIHNGIQTSFLATPNYSFSPNSYSIIHGRYVGGNLASLQATDGNELIVATGVTASSSDLQIGIQVSGISPILTPNHMNISVPGYFSNASNNQTIEIWNYSTSQWMQLGTASVN